MKRLLLGSVFMTFFAMSIIIFQVSCQKDAIANPESNSITGVTQQDKIIYIKQDESTNVREIWCANYDGSN